MVYLLDKAHGDEFVAYYVPGLIQSCQILVEARVFRFDILLDDFHLQVLLTLCTIVGTGAFLLLRRLALIQEALENVMKKRTCVVIAHRLSTIRNADRIIVLHHGEVREMGSHSELMARGGIYHRLYQLQYEREELKLISHDSPQKVTA